MYVHQLLRKVQPVKGIAAKTPEASEASEPQKPKPQPFWLLASATGRGAAVQPMRSGFAQFLKAWACPKRNSASIDPSAAWVYSAHKLEARGAVRSGPSPKHKRLKAGTPHVWFRHRFKSCGCDEYGRDRLGMNRFRGFPLKEEPRA